MKKIITILLTLMVIFAITTAAFADTSSLPGAGWWSGEQIQNVGDTTATITITAYDAASSNTFTASQDVAAGEAFTFIPSSFAGMPDGFQGSAVVSSAEPIKAIVNVLNKVSGSLGVAGGLASAMYQGVDSSMVATTLYFPLVKGDNFSKTTTFIVQNAGTAPATITGNFTMRDGSTYTYNSPSSVGVYQMIVFTVLDATGYTPGANNRVGSLVVTSAQPMAGTVMEHLTNENPATWVSSTRGFISGDFSTKAFAPVVKNLRTGKFTGIQVQNVSGGSINVTVTYTGASRNTPCFGSTYTDTRNNVLAGTAVTIVQLTSQGSNLPSNCTASATIEATGNFVAVVNESYLAGYPTPVQSQGTLFAIPTSSTTTKVSAPLFKDDINGKRTGLQIQNVGSSTATNIVATFTCRGTPSAPINFTAISQPQTVVSGGSVQFYTPSDNASNPTTEPQFTPANPFARNNVNCSVTITGDQPIVAIANETSTPGYSIILDDSNYEAFNLVP